MAVSTDPLRRPAVRLIANDTGDRLQAPRTNRALQLADALGDLRPAAREAADAVADSLQERAEARAARDAITTQGAELADAVREGRIEPTQNPWYMTAYRRESAAVRGQTALQRLQVEAATWAERNDPAAFAARWGREVAAVGEALGEDQDTTAGFLPVARQYTQQVTATIAAQNVQRVEAERFQNLSALAANALADAARRNAGRLTPNQAHAALEPAKLQWIATGGSLAQWNEMVVQAVVSASNSISSDALLDLIPAPELIQGPSEAGAALMPPRSRPSTPPTGAPAPGEAAPAPSATRVAPQRHLPIVGPVNGRFGERRSRRGGGYRQHGGVDIGAPVGTPIPAAPLDGEVLRSGESGDAGLRVVVRYSNGAEATYMHLSSTSLQPGDRVAAGQVVGLTGGRRGAPGAGNSKGPHLHYQLRVGGVLVDPVSYEWSGEAAPAGSSIVPAPPLPPAPVAAPGQTLAETISRGPSLYDIAGVAETVEAARSRIASRVANEAADRFRAIQAERSLRALELSDRWWGAYGTNLLTGQFDRGTLIRQGAEAGYTPQEISLALGQLRGGVADSVGVDNARLEAQGQEPEEARRLLDIAAEGRRNGWTQDYQDRLGREVLAGRLSRQEAEQMVGSAISRTQQLEAEGRAEEAAGRRALAESGAVRSYSSLRDNARALASQIILEAQRVRIPGAGRIRLPTGSRGEAARASIEQAITQAMEAHIARNPGDWDGANTAGRNAAARILRSNVTRHLRANPQVAPRTTGVGSRGAAAAPSSQDNPRRTQ